MEREIYIVGAHSRARTLGVYLTRLDPGTKIKAYIYDNDEPNADSIDGIPVKHFDENTLLETDFPVYLGTRGMYHAALSKKLRNMGMKEIIPITPQLDMELRNRFLTLYYAERGRTYERFDSVLEAVCIYVVRSVFDKPLKQVYKLSIFQKEIQVGAALTEERVCGLTDDIGENISVRNRQFCELTALYWIWRNVKQDIVGLEHYRRHFLLQDDWYWKMLERRIDTILPTPLYVAPNLAQNYKDRHTASDWNFMMDYLKLIYPHDYKAAIDFFDTNLYSPCNMFIMKKCVLDDLCTWMFPILFACAEHGGEHNDSYQNRFPGFLAERLMTFFFEKHREKYKIVYADKEFLE
ncbi:MAG: DUF4422 domain-containing protein [Lachnospiraceae bacterium]|jgi:hypothetical protein|nr:DUF4422 domain-containing protein [Lachnospiraceae bacterium]